MARFHISRILHSVSVSFDTAHLVRLLQVSKLSRCLFYVVLVLVRMMYELFKRIDQQNGRAWFKWVFNPHLPLVS